MGHVSFPHIHSNEDDVRRKSHLDPNFQLFSPLLVDLAADKSKQKQVPGSSLTFESNLNLLPRERGQFKNAGLLQLQEATKNCECKILLLFYYFYFTRSHTL